MERNLRTSLQEDKSPLPRRERRKRYADVRAGWLEERWSTELLAKKGWRLTGVSGESSGKTSLRATGGDKRGA